MNHIPNIITFFRLVLIVPFVVALLAGDTRLAVILLLIAGLSDGLDGYLARRFSWSSRLGAIADPLADKALLTSTYIALGWLGVFPLSVVAVVLARDALIVSGALIYWLRFGPYQMQPSWLGKTSTAIQTGVGLLGITHTGLMPLSDELWLVCVAAVVLITALSGGHYLWVWTHKAREALLQERQQMLVAEETDRPAYQHPAPKKDPHASRGEPSKVSSDRV